MNDESVQPRSPEAIQDVRQVVVRGPCEVECLDVLAEWCEIGGVQVYELGVSDLQRLTEACATAANPYSGHERHS